MNAAEPPIDNWDPVSVEHAAEVFADAPFRWWICGGTALELFVGDGWRPHEDLDIGVLRIEASEVHGWLSSDWELWIAARGTLTPWRGAPLSPEQQENNIWVRQGPNAAWVFDLTVGSGDETEWIYRRDETTRRPSDTTIQRTTDGIPYLTPEIQLLFKSKNPKPKDDLDAEKVIPLLNADQRAFLKAAVPDAHPWREILGNQ